MKLIECVPNFSEGSDPKTLNEIKNAIISTPNVKLLSFEPDKDYNRLVVTMVGDENSILEGAINASVAAANNIDMTKHKGNHPRLGAIDVVPFVPISNATVDECVQISKKYAKEISEKLNLPVYLYESAQEKSYRKNLADIRKGEYEGLPEKLKNPDWEPDYGKAEFNPKLGATVTGCRFFLIAYNVNIKSEDINYSKEIAETIREIGKPKRDENGKIIKVNGETVRIPGKFKAVKAMGVPLEQYHITQVSINLVNYKITPMHIVFEEVKNLANKMGVEVDGSEIVGLIPLDAMLEAGRFYAGNKTLREQELVNLAIDKLGLSSLHPFKPEEKIIEYMIK
jgi:glutamate formiminotransferase/formiminotetrahydrofolate cyclodeaminase